MKIKWLLSIILLSVTSPTVKAEPLPILQTGTINLGTAITGTNTMTLEGHLDGPVFVAADDGPLEPDPSVDDDSTDTGTTAGRCDLKAVAFANVTFNTQAQAQAKCDELIQQTSSDATCTIKRLNNGKRQAQFRLNLNIVQQGLNVLLQGLANFIQQNSVFVNQQLKIQAAVSNGCG